MERISELESQVYENRDEAYRNRNNILDADSVRKELLAKIEDLKHLNEEDQTQLNTRLTKRIDDMQKAINELENEVNDVDRKRINSENEILKKSLEMLREGNIDTDIKDLKRRTNSLENEVFKPKQKEEPKLKLEEEKIIKDIFEGITDLEREIKNLKKQVGEHDIDIQDAAKLLHILDQQAIKDKEAVENLGRRIDSADALKDSFNKYKANNDKNLDDLRLACESEFNNVKKAEINDFNNLNNRLNDLTGIQDILEQLANQVDHLQQEVDGIKNNKATPIKMKNKVGNQNIMSSMTPTTTLFSDIKSRLDNAHGPDDSTDLDRATATNKPNLRGKNILSDFSDKKSNPVIDKIRESYFSKSKLARHLDDDSNQRNREFIQIDNHVVKPEELKDKLKSDDQNSPSPYKSAILDLKADAVMPNSYKVTKLEEEKSPRDESAKRPNQLKNIYEKQKEMNKDKSDRNKDSSKRSRGKGSSRRMDDE